MSQLTDGEVKVVLCNLASMVLVTNRKLDLVIQGKANASEVASINADIAAHNTQILLILNQP